MYTMYWKKVVEGIWHFEHQSTRLRLTIHGQNALPAVSRSLCESIRGLMASHLSGCITRYGGFQCMKRYCSDVWEAHRS